MKSPWLGLCCARGNTEWVPEGGQEQIQRGDPLALPGGWVPGCSHMGIPKLSLIGDFTSPRSFHCILREQPI